MRAAAAGFLVIALGAASAAACLWDADTLQMERKRFPGVNELITGRFVRHSKAYYEWRIRDRTERLISFPGDPALIDDLAVGYDKLGRQAEGIAVLEAAMAKHPDRYETVSNLGTLLIHAGRMDEGARLIERAIEINPDAHFGRERYQLLLVRYAQQSGSKLKGVMSVDSRWNKSSAIGFSKFVLKEAGLPEFGLEDSDLESRTPDQKSAAKELDRALKGILGILHFGNYESPMVLEALGDVLLRRGQGYEDARLLAARAYLRAAHVSSNEDVQRAFEKMAHESLIPNEDFHAKPEEKTIDVVGARLRQEVADAQKWFQRIAKDEAMWIREGQDVDAAFAAKYYDSLERAIDSATDAIAKEPLDDRDGYYYSRQSRRRLLILAGIGVGLIAAAFVVYRVVRRKTTPQTSTKF
jgi:tetratricopeptide (TPR) repeat protein